MSISSSHQMKSVFNFRVPAGLYKEIDKRARDRNMGLAAYLRSILIDHVGGMDSISKRKAVPIPREEEVKDGYEL